MPTNLYKISGCKSGLLAFPSNRWKSWGTEGHMNYQPWISAGAQNQNKHPCLYGQLCLISARGGNTALKEAFKLLAPCPFLCAVTGNTPAPQAKCRLCPQWTSAISGLAHSQSHVSRGTEDMGSYELFLCPFRGCGVIPVTGFAASLDIRGQIQPTINCSQVKGKGNKNDKNFTEVINLQCLRSPFKINPYSVTYMFKYYRT